MDNYTFTNNYTREDTNENRITEMTRYVFICFMVLIIVIGIPGNTIVVAVLTKLQERTSTDYFVLAMSGIDLFSAAVNTLGYIIRYEPSIWLYIASETFCRLHHFSIGLTNTCTTVLFSAVAIDRLRVTRSSTTTYRQSNSVKVKRITFGLVILSCVLSIAFPLMKTFDLSSLSCTRLPGYETIITMFYIIVALIYAFLLVAVIVCYIWIGLTLRRHNSKTRDVNTNVFDHKADRKKSTWTKTSKIEPINTKENLPSTSEGISNYNRQLESQGTLPQKKLTRNHARNKIITTVTNEQKTTDKGDNKYNNKAKGDHFIVSYKNDVVDTAEQAQEKNNCIKEAKPIYSLHPINSNKKERKRINRTTLMMFLLTLVYVGTWIINWTASIYGAIIDSRTTGLVFLSLKLYMINYATNPVFYIIMSSKFKQNAKAMFCRT